MKELFGKRNFIVLYAFLMELINLPLAYENALKPFYDETEIKKRLLFLKLMEIPSAKWTTKDYIVIVDTINFMMGQACEHRDKIDLCFYKIDRMMRKEENYLWNRESAFVLRKILDNISEKGNYTIDFTEHWNGETIIISC